MNYKQNTRSPLYGKIVTYDTQGRVIKEFDILRTIVEHEGVEYTIGQLLSLVHNHDRDVAILENKVEKLESQNKVQDERIVALEENIRSLVIAVQNLSDVINGTEIIAGE